MIELFLKGLLIALVFGVPAGAIGALTIQHTIEHGFWTGLLTGLGSSAADVLYACVGVFGLTLISDFLTTHQMWISLCGGILIVLYGIFIFRKKVTVPDERGTSGKPLWCFFSSFLMAILNPAAVVSFLLAFSAFGIEGTLDIVSGVSLVAGIFCGTLLWWMAISGIVSLFRKKITEKIYGRLNRILGVLLFAFGIAMCMRGIMGVP